MIPSRLASTRRPWPKPARSVYLDGSQVTLRPDSVIRVSLSKRRRQVDLERGGAYFEVERDPTRAFTVQTAATQVQVLGTKFDVLKGPQEVQVSVSDGHVEFNAVAPDAAASKAGRTVQLTAGEQITAAYSGTFGAKHRFDPANTLAWRGGRLSYANARLEEVVADMNRYRHVKVRIEGEALRNITITAAFRVDQSDQMLAGLAATEPVLVERRPDEVVLSLAVESPR